MNYECVYLIIHKKAPEKSYGYYCSWEKALSKIQVDIDRGWELLHQLEAKTGKEPTYRTCDFNNDVYTVELYYTAG